MALGFKLISNRISCFYLGEKESDDDLPHRRWKSDGDTYMYV